MLNKSYRSAAILALLGLTLAPMAEAGRQVQFVFTSDPHFGLNRSVFQEEKNIDSRYANKLMVEKINSLPGVSFPADEELKAGQMIGGIDFVTEGGDISNRMEASGIVQSSAASWDDFDKIYLHQLNVKTPEGQTAPLFIMPGNHDVTNAIGYYNRMDPKTDATTMVEIYNRMMKPAVPLTKETYDYKVNKIHYSRDVKGLHLVFVNVWPDSSERAWLSQDLANIPNGTPVILFAHDEPDVETKHLTNPNGKHDINKDDKFENILSEQMKGGTKVGDKSTENERGLANFIKQHTEIKAYFHGNSHEPDFKAWMGPDFDFMLPTFSVDSPVKGTASAKNETMVSFQVATVDLDEQKITVRECYWNKHPLNKNAPLAWGNHTTLDFRQPPVPEPVTAPAVEPVAAPVAAPDEAPAVAPAPAPIDATQPVAAPVAN